MSEEYTDSEEYLMYSFEKLFLFEFYVRKLRLDQSREFENLLQLKKDIHEEVAGLDLFDEEDFIDADDLVPFVLSFLQFDYDRSLLESKLDAFGISGKLIADIVDICQKFKNTSKVNLPINTSYRFSDLVYSNDILEIIGWWDKLTDERTRREWKLEEKFGHSNFNFQINNLDDTKNSVVYSFPFKCPDIIQYQRDNYCIFNSNYDDININKETLRNSLVLSISTNEPADNIDNILEEYRSLFCLVQATANWDLLNPEIDSATEVPVPMNIENLLKVPDSKPYTDIVKDKRKSNQFLGKYTSISKWLIGLHCYDIGVEKKLNQDKSADEVISNLEKLNCYQGFEKRTVQKYCKKTKDTILSTAI
jgi:hypothetical protein